LLYLKGPAFSIVVNPLKLCLKAISAQLWLKNGSGEDADLPSSRRAAFHGRAIVPHVHTPIMPETSAMVSSLYYLVNLE
jgi:hypothetical protein